MRDPAAGPVPMVRVACFVLLLLLTSLYALARGGRREQAAALTFVLAFAASRAAAVIGGGRFRHVEWTIFSIDFAVLCALLALAVGSGRRSPGWLNWCCAIQAAAIFIHVGRFIGGGGGVVNWAYYALAEFGAYPMLLLLAWGVWQQARATARPN